MASAPATLYRRRREAEASAPGVVGLVGTPLETLRELFADVWMVLVCSPVYYGMYFAVYEPLKRFLSGVLPSGHRSLFRSSG